jgi:dTDP-4-amino-4,6-dideoxygalactose transaminase
MGFLRIFRSLWNKYGLAHAGRYLVNHLLLRRHLNWPVYGSGEKRNLKQVLRSREWGGLPFPNRFAEEFTKRFADLQTARFGVCTTNGTAALHVAYKAAGLEKGDEIIVPALTFSATASAALVQGIRPVFVDVDPGTMCIDAEAARQAITEKTKAIVAVHLGSQMADMDSLLAMAQECGIPVIEDCAHAPGARWGDRGAGSLGAMGCFSFQSTKVLTAGEGGMILTNDEKLAARCRSHVSFGREGGSEDTSQALLGSNYRMTDFQAAVLLAQLERLPDQTRRRHENARLLTELLGNVQGVRTLRPYPKVSTQAIYGYYLRYIPEDCGGVPRATFVRDLREHGIPALEEMYLPVYRSPEFGWRDAPIDVDYAGVRCPVADKAASEELVWMQRRVFRAGRREVEWMGGIIDWLLKRYRAGSD